MEDVRRLSEECGGDSGGCVWRVCEGCREALWWVWGGSLEVVGRISGG